MRGRKPKPTQLHRTDGTLHATKHRDRATELQLDGDLLDPPAGLSPAQADIWREAIGQAPPGLLKRLDRSVFLTWVRAVDVQNVAQHIINTEGIVADSPAGGVTEHPAIRTFQKMSLLILRCAEQMGFSPAARPRIHVAKPDEKQNPFTAFSGSQQKAQSKPRSVH